jgi:hypothetical protein
MDDATIRTLVAVALTAQDSSGEQALRALADGCGFVVQVQTMVEDSGNPAGFDALGWTCTWGSCSPTPPSADSAPSPTWRPGTAATGSRICSPWRKVVRMANAESAVAPHRGDPPDRLHSIEGDAL